MQTPTRPSRLPLPGINWWLTRRWFALLTSSALLVTALEALHLPAALLLGPMIAGVILAAAGGGVRVPPLSFHAAQGIVGCLIASSITLDTMREALRDWPLFLAFAPSVLVIAMALGWLLARLRVLPGTTAVWGSVPGAATAMTLLAESFGADQRLVAFMQYSRVLTVAVAASSILRIWGAAGGTPPAIVWFPPIAWPQFGETLLLVALGTALARRLPIPGGPLLIPMLTAITLQDLGLLTLDLPPWLLTLSYALVGWSVGLRFTRTVLIHAWRALPRVAASILTLITICGGLSTLLVVFAGIDPLTAYLATSPGGADTVAIIAASSAVNRPFVMAMQTTRFLVVLFTGPVIARFVAARTRAPSYPSPAPLIAADDTRA